MRIPVCCAVIIRDHRVLAVQRSKEMPLPGKWEFPGGKVEGGETEQECILREIREELNIKVQVDSRLTPSVWETANRIIELVPYRCRWLSGELQLNEHANKLWLTIDQLLSVDWAEADIPIAKEIRNSMR